MLIVYDNYGFVFVLAGVYGVVNTHLKNAGSEKETGFKDISKI